MGTPLKNMEIPISHWAPFPRRHPSPFPLVTVQRDARKNHWVRHTFPSCNFSLILQGTGEYRCGSTVYPVQSPCVITQWPGQYLEYGPPPGQTWDELYLIYDSSLFGPLQRARLLRPDKPMWPILNIAAVEEQIAQLYDLAASSHPEEVVDRIDRVCERMVLETWLAPPALEVDSDDARAVQAVLQEIRHDLRRPVDLDKLIARHGFSQATFRRRWARFVRTPPAKYRMELRLREACRLLTQTARPIRQIARDVGFDDELYFSRCFHAKMRLAPRAYRKMYRMVHSTGRNTVPAT